MLAATADLNQFPAAELAAKVAQGKCTAVELAEACLARIAKREKEVQAWAHIDPEQVFTQARA